MARSGRLSQRLSSEQQCSNARLSKSVNAIDHAHTCPFSSRNAKDGKGNDGRRLTRAPAPPN